MNFDIYDVISGIVLAMALISTFRNVRLAIRHKRLRLIYGIISFFCFAVAVFYGYLLALSPDISIGTAALGRVLIILLFGAIIMFTFIVDK